MRASLRRHPIVAFFALTYLLAWSVWVPAALAAQGRIAVQVPLFALGGLAPSLSGLILTAWVDGRGGMRAIGRALLRGRVHVLWYVAVVAVPIALGALALLGFRLAGGELREVPWPSPAAVLPLFLLITLLGGGLNEELGWRGFALPRLQRRHGALSASLAVGLAWSLWHLPLFFIPGTGQEGIPIGWYVAEVLAVSVLFTWIFNGTGGSLLLVILLHGTFNTTLVILQERVEAIAAAIPYLTAVLWLAVLGLVLRYGARALSPRPRVTRLG